MRLPPLFKCFLEKFLLPHYCPCLLLCGAESRASLHFQFSRTSRSLRRTLLRLSRSTCAFVLSTRQFPINSLRLSNRQLFAFKKSCNPVLRNFSSINCQCLKVINFNVYDNLFFFVHPWQSWSFNTYLLITSFTSKPTSIFWGSVF